MRIGRHPVGAGNPPLIVAELSANHNGLLDRALAVVDAVAQAGAHFLKLQTYTADTMTLDVDRPEFRIGGEGTLWDGRTLYDLYREGSTPWEWHAPIAERCRERGLDWFSSPFDPSAVEFLTALEPAAYKIASFEIVDLQLIRAVAATGKPVVISTGISTRSTARSGPRARPGVRTWSCSSALAPTPPRRATRTWRRSRTSGRPSTAPSACPITRWASGCRSPPSGSVRC
jgi:N-acetylneuraminate synthase